MYNKKMWKKIKSKFLNKPKEKIDYLLVGLGNPGEKYKKTLHNSGFRAVSFLREELMFPSFSKDKILNSAISKGRFEEKTIVIILPLTYMNLSGGAVKKATERFDVELKNIILVHDDTDLPQKTVRFSFSRGSAGHKGVSSVIKSLRTKDFFRVRIGVEREERKALDVVLSETPKDLYGTEKMVAEEIKKSLSLGFSTKTIVLEKQKKTL
jgi:peptidyl-tRNA hydrolase, PTH1 family